jgi:hypothetical protein
VLLAEAVPVVLDAAAAAAVVLLGALQLQLLLRPAAGCWWLVGVWKECGLGKMLHLCCCLVTAVLPTCHSQHDRLQEQLVMLQLLMAS